MEQIKPEKISLANLSAQSGETIKRNLQQSALALGFQKLAVCDVDLSAERSLFADWLRRGFQADMTYLERYTEQRMHPELLLPGTCRVICVRMNYLPSQASSLDILLHPRRAYVARYALGRDYHRFIRKRLQRLADELEKQIGGFGYRVLCDSAPVLEKALAQKAGLGWIGKNTLLLDKDAGSWFFLGEIYTDLPLPVDEPVQPHCGRCKACLDICPTGALVAPYQLDARKCIAYLTIENKVGIPIELRSLIGNRVFGCDDCQWVCPWNRFAQPSAETTFAPRHGLDVAELLSLFEWTEQEFQVRSQGAPIRRAGYWGWLRNLSVALGNAPYQIAIVNALQAKLELSNMPEWLPEHFNWAIDQQLMAAQERGIRQSEIAQGKNQPD